MLARRILLFSIALVLITGFGLPAYAAKSIFREPINACKRLSSGADLFVMELYRVPEDQILVIETLSISISGEYNLQVLGGLVINTRGDDSDLSFRIPLNESPSFGASIRFTAFESFRIYAEPPGSVVNIFVEKISGVSYDAEACFSGHLRPYDK